jgi:hypothetical protein
MLFIALVDRCRKEGHVHYASAEEIIPADTGLRLAV